jgi:hypothetical protein
MFCSYGAVFNDHRSFLPRFRSYGAIRTTAIVIVHFVLTIAKCSIKF